MKQKTFEYNIAAYLGIGIGFQFDIESLNNNQIGFLFILPFVFIEIYITFK